LDPVKVYQQEWQCTAINVYGIFFAVILTGNFRSGVNMKIRVGQGLDVHKLVPDRPLVLGGVTIPFDRGLAGHSDADVLVHAVCDALLGLRPWGISDSIFPIPMRPIGTSTA